MLSSEHEKRNLNTDVRENVRECSCSPSHTVRHCDKTLPDSRSLLVQDQSTYVGGPNLQYQKRTPVPKTRSTLFEILPRSASPPHGWHTRTPSIESHDDFENKKSQPFFPPFSHPRAHHHQKTLVHCHNSSCHCRKLS